MVKEMPEEEFCDWDDLLDEEEWLEEDVEGCILDVDDEYD